MKRNERLKKIEDLLLQCGKIEVASLCQMFNVSEMTIRRDLTILVEKRKAVRSHGGAILPADSILTERPYNLRYTVRTEQKKAIAKAAITLLDESNIIFFDSSTTAHWIAKLMTDDYSILAVTDTLYTALELNVHPNVRVITLGGETSKTTGSGSGIFAEATLKAMTFDIAFIGAPSIAADGTVSIASTSELSIKRMVIQQSKLRILVADSSKVGDIAFLHLAHISEFDIFITDSGISESFYNYCKQQGIRIIVADV